ncbi:hypothetical protein ACVIIV_005309 [Bradyrhizobium sp. USDA 4354]
MPRGQFYTVFTLGFATAVGLLGIAAGTLLFWSKEAGAWALIVLNAHQVPQGWLEPGYIALFVAGAAVFTAYWIVRIQQAIVRWSGDRLLAKLNREYRAVAQAEGTEYADEFIKRKVLAMAGDEARHFSFFGRDEMLLSLAAHGIRAQPPA